MNQEVVYSPEPEDQAKFTGDFDKFYTTFARLYDIGVRIAPFWKRWLKTTLPHIEGPRVLEVSFGTGYLMCQYAARYETYGLEYNTKFVSLVRKNLMRLSLPADIRQGDVMAMPYADAYFNSIVNTMAFSAYPDGNLAMSEMHRVLKPGGKLLIVDVNYPRDRNRLGVLATRAWMAAGDIIRDMAPLFEQFGFSYYDEEIGGFGSVHLYVAEKLRSVPHV